MSEFETLDQAISKAAGDWSDQDIADIVAGMREGRRIWNSEQAAGSRKLVRSKDIGIPQPDVGKLKSIKGLKITL